MLDNQSESSSSSSESQTVRLKIQVEDSGIGISPEKFGLLFQRFSTLHDEGIQPGGTGLGLALCKKVASRMGGDVVLETSKLNEGSVFAVALPFKTGPISVSEEPFQKVMQEYQLQRSAFPVMGCVIRETSFDFLSFVCRSIGFESKRVLPDDISEWINSLPSKNAVLVCDVSIAIEFANLSNEVPVFVLLPPDYLSQQRRRHSSSITESVGSSVADSLGKFPKKYHRILLPIRRIALFQSVIECLKANQTQNPSEPMQLDEERAELFPGLKVMIVEDNRVNQKVLCKMLSSLSVTPVAVVENGQKSLDFFQKEIQSGNASPADIVFMVRVCW